MEISSFGKKDQIYPLLAMGKRVTSLPCTAAVRLSRGAKASYPGMVYLVWSSMVTYPFVVAISDGHIRCFWDPI